MFTLNDLLNATAGRLINKAAEIFTAASIDSRTIDKGELFFALKGTKRDGHEFLMEALEKSSGAVISRYQGEDFSCKTVVMVDDTLIALQLLGKYIRSKFHGKVIAVLGSNGKTTTKELIGAFLSKKYGVLKTEGNLNNQIGVPLCLSRISSNTEMMVLELGTNRKGDIRELCEIVLPQFALITNIGYEHIEGFGSLEGVREGELEVLPYVGTLFVNGDDSFLMEGLREWKGRIITFGITNKCDYYASEITLKNEGIEFIFNSKNESFSVKSKLIGLHNVYNLTAACAVARYFQISESLIKEALESFSPPKMRSEIVRIDGVEIFFDAYNANPSSMRAALEELSRRKAERRAIAVLGDMLELGDYTQKAHEDIGLWVKDLKIDKLIGVGKFIKNALRYVDGKVFSDSVEAGEFLKNFLKEGDIVLIKGSRAMRMERILEILSEENKK